MTASNDKSSLKISLEDTFKIDSFDEDKFGKGTNKLLGQYGEYFTNSLNQEVSSYMVIFNLWCVFSLLSCIPLPVISNASILLLMGYYILGNNVHKKIGIENTLFLSICYLSNCITSYILSHRLYMIISLIGLPASTAVYVLGNIKYEKKHYKELLDLKYELIFIAPLYSYICLNTKYRLKEKANRAGKFMLNYVKKYSTSDVISDELKDRGVDDLDDNKNTVELQEMGENDVCGEDNEKNLDVDESKKEV